MAGMTSIYIGVTGLQASQTSLNTTSHNLANVNTKGYVRQLSFTGDTVYNKVGQSATSQMQVGLGVASTSTSRVRDILLDSQYRKENGRQGFYSSQYEAVTEIETVIGETEGVRFQNTIEDLWSAISETAKTPDSIVTRSELVMKAETFIDRAKSIYGEFTDYQKNLDKKVLETVDKINSLGDKINELNLKIAGVEASVENANDLRDKRDLALDELSKYINISYQETENHYVTVKAEGTPFVTEGIVYHMDTAQLDGEQGSTYLSCIWPHVINNGTNSQEVFNLEEEISTANKNDIGSLKGYVLARGDYVADYTDVPDAKNYDLTTADGQNKYNQDVDAYNSKVESCSVMKAEALFDRLINGIVETINDVLSPMKNSSVDGMPEGVTTFTAGGKTYTKADGVRYLDMSTSTGNDGKMPPEELFSRENTSRYIEATGDDGKTYYIYNDKNTAGYDSYYTLSNINVNQTVLEDYSKLPFKTLQGDNDLTKGEALVKEWNKEQMSYDPNNASQLKFKEFYNEFVYDMGNKGSLYKSIADNQETTTSQIDDARSAITGVSSEEELTNMIKFQSAYNASSRYVTTIADMLNYIIEKLG